MYYIYIYINTDPPQVVPTSWGHHAGYAAFCQIEIHQSNWGVAGIVVSELCYSHRAKGEGRSGRSLILKSHGSHGEKQ